MERVDQLDAWKKGHLLALRAFHLTAGFPAEDRHGLIEPIRRAAVAVPVRIAEGFNGSGVEDQRRLYQSARGAVEELRYYFILSTDLGFKGVETLHLEKCDEVAEMLEDLIEDLEFEPPI